MRAASCLLSPRARSSRRRPRTNGPDRHIGGDADVRRIRRAREGTSLPPLAFVLYSRAREPTQITSTTLQAIPAVNCAYFAIGRIFCPLYAVPVKASSTGIWTLL